MMVKTTLLLCVASSLIDTSSGFCWFNCAEETTTTTMKTTTTPALEAWQCRNCSQWSYCSEWAENGVCNECACPKGIAGPCCDKIERNRCLLEPNLCPPRSTCEFDVVNGYKCVCHGKGVGPDCREPGPCEYNPCVNGGVCREPSENVTFGCDCPSGMKGNLCESTTLCGFSPCACDRHKCKNNATCFVKGMSAIVTYSCHCKPGYTGEYCEEEMPCVYSNPCKHGGVCQVDPRNPMNFRCLCTNIFSGRLCEIYNPCHALASQCKHGSCRPVSENKGECFCIPGYNGTLCENDIDDCTPNPCEYDGICTDKVNNFTCACPEGTSGHRCEINFDDCLTKTPGVNACALRDRSAVCIDGLNSFSCNCSKDWTGEHCTMRMIIWEVIKSFNDTDISLLD
uniref:EGF-like domain-containing protein n=1 Tax=Steinernema glaseri TaxID=37863 RepID=A0A1I8ARK1_9BILA